MADPPIESSRVARYALIAVGIVCVVLGAIGVVLPVLPTTPFLLLAAACFLRSSPRFHQWLLNNRVLGLYIRDYCSGKGIPLRAKIVSISLLWLTIGYAVIFVIEPTWLRALLLLIAVVVSAHIISIRPRQC